MESSSYYKAKIEKFEGYKGKVSSVSGKLNNPDESLGLSTKFVDNVVINGEAIDKGVLSGTIGSGIASIESNLASVIGECDKKIEEYTALYKQALIQEEEARQRQLALQRKKNNTKETTTL